MSAAVSAATGAAAGATGSSGRRVIVLGGTSEIALAIVRELQMLAARDVALVGRDPDALSGAAESLRAAGCNSVSTFELDALDTERHEEVLARAFGEQIGRAHV